MLLSHDHKDNWALGSHCTPFILRPEQQRSVIRKNTRIVRRAPYSNSRAVPPRRAPSFQSQRRTTGRRLRADDATSSRATGPSRRAAPRPLVAIRSSTARTGQDYPSPAPPRPLAAMSRSKTQWREGSYAASRAAACGSGGSGVPQAKPCSAAALCIRSNASLKK